VDSSRSIDAIPNEDLPFVKRFTAWNDRPYQACNVLSACPSWTRRLIACLVRIEGLRVSVVDGDRS
jgi:hypothetical protein